MFELTPTPNPSCHLYGRHPIKREGLQLHAIRDEYPRSHILGMLAIEMARGPGDGGCSNV